MKEFSPKHSKRIDPRQAEREVRKAARKDFSFGKTTLLFVGADGGEYYSIEPITPIPGYTPAF